MANKLRVFISSTMKDLRNERQQVVDRLNFLGFEPVNAEEFSPNGQTSWEVIEPKIRDCHLFVLLLGDSYGWEPKSGYGGGEGKSVTHLEYDAARALNIPVLPFIKKLEYGSKEDKLRDAFREAVAAWDTGHFRAEFELAKDLADKVAKALVDFCTQTALKELLRLRDAQLTPPPAAVQSAESLPVHDNDKWVLLGGAGLSISAGYPTANLIISSLAAQLWPDVAASDIYTRYSFDEVAEYYESQRGREALLQDVKALLDTPQKVWPTGAHFEAVKKFKTILTTNYDPLFEIACMTNSIPYVVITPSDPKLPEKGKVSIIKLSGTLSELESLRLTAKDLQDVMANEAFFTVIKQSLAGRKVAVVGHALRDAHVLKALTESGVSGPGVYVSPNPGPAADIILQRFNLQAKPQKADAFLASFDPDSVM
ncbi:DUF4062 domain-containing protein [Kosakonia radicincitans]|uniref:DUF4062 domain-containing protein n=1 Tax=Kosakonia radicincitans TaxID=283686 RepID=UPI001D06239D|nr:DUF4062 domain-containing protein [Kosakonia radicincitans]